MSRLEGQVAFISGVARGQGRSHAVRLAEEGADIIGFDVCEQIDTVAYPLATEDDLAETIKLVEDRGRRIVARKADVRDLAAVQGVFDEGRSELGGVDIVLPNAGATFGFPATDFGTLMRGWQDSLDVMVTGVLNTVVAALPTLIDQGRGGSIVITSSTAGLKGIGVPANTVEDVMGPLGYSVAKTGVIAIMKGLATNLAHHNIRVNTIHPTGVNTKFLKNEVWEKILKEHEEHAKGWRNALPVELIEPEDVSNAIVWLSSDEARYVTGIELRVDAGFMLL